jgi:hypothetical protein
MTQERQSRPPRKLRHRRRRLIDERLARQVQGARYSSEKELETGLLETLIDVGGEPFTVRAARDHMSQVLRNARNGTVQLIGRSPEETVVIMSLTDLVDLIRVALGEPRTLGEALDQLGFKPTGRRVVVRQSRKEE